MMQPYTSAPRAPRASCFATNLDPARCASDCQALEAVMSSRPLVPPSLRLVAGPHTAAQREAGRYARSSMRLGAVAGGDSSDAENEHEALSVVKAA